MIKKIFVLSLLVSFLTLSLMAGDPTLDRLIDNMSTHDVSSKEKAKQQLYYLCRYGHDDLLHSYLKHEKIAKRLAALSVAASLKKVSDDSMALIASCLDHTDPLVKRAAANCLGAYQSKDAADFLAKALSGEVSTRVVVLNALAKSGQKVGSDEIVLQLNDTDDKIRYAAANTMFRCQIDDKADALKKALEAEKAREPANIYQADFKERIIALLQASLLVTGEAEGKELATAMQVKNTWVRELAIEAFGIHKEVDILISSCFENFENGNGRLRLSAAQAFTALAPVKNFPKIIALMETEKEGEIREELAASLRRISKHNFGYNGHDSEKARATSLKAWSKWWLQNAYRYGLSSE